MKALITDLTATLKNPPTMAEIIPDVFSGLAPHSSVEAISSICQVVVGENPKAVELTPPAKEAISAILDDEETWEEVYGSYVVDALSHLVSEDVREDAYVRIILKQANEAQTPELVGLLSKLEESKEDDVEQVYADIEREYHNIFKTIAVSDDVADDMATRVEAWRIDAVKRAEAAKKAEAALQETAALVPEGGPANEPNADVDTTDNVVQLQPKADNDAGDDLLA